MNRSSRFPRKQHKGKFPLSPHPLPENVQSGGCILFKKQVLSSQFCISLFDPGWLKHLTRLSWASISPHPFFLTFQSFPLPAPSPKNVRLTAHGAWIGEMQPWQPKIWIQKFSIMTKDHPDYIFIISHYISIYKTVCKHTFLKKSGTSIQESTCNDHNRCSAISSFNILCFW